jgi:hypothetical protein
MNETNQHKLESLLMDYKDKKKYGEITIKYEAGEIIYIKASETFKNEDKNNYLTNQN